MDLRAGRIDEAIAELDKNTPTQDRIDEHLERGVSPTHVNPDGDAKAKVYEAEQQRDGNVPVEPPSAIPASAPVPQSAIYPDWESHNIPGPGFKLKYFEQASKNFRDRYRCAVQGSAFTKILAILKDKPQQVLSNADDFAQLAVVLRGASDNLNILAAAITTALAHRMEPEPKAKSPSDEERR